MGALENMQEEIIPLVPVLLVLGQGLGVDAVAVVAMSAGAAMLGSAFGPTNPFQAGIALKLAEAGANVALVDLGNPTDPALTYNLAAQTDLMRTVEEVKRREVKAMPILADALQDAGCDSDDVLDHCRGLTGGGSGEPAGGYSAQTTHVRGCWVCDLVLGNE